MGSARTARIVCAFLLIILTFSDDAAPAGPYGERQAALVDHYLFLATDDRYLIGSRIVRSADDVRVDNRFARDRAYLESLAARTSDSGTPGPLEFEVLAGAPLPSSPGCEFARSPSELVVDSGCGHCELHTRSGPLAGLERYWQHATTSSCYAEAGIAYNKRDHGIKYAKVPAREGLADEFRRDCLFRRMMIALGVKLSEKLARSNGAVSTATQAEMLEALSLLYDPRLRPGMNRREVHRALSR